MRRRQPNQHRFILELVLALMLANVVYDVAVKPLVEYAADKLKEAVVSESVGSALFKMEVL